jgi:putative oxidoreductase
MYSTVLYCNFCNILIMIFLLAKRSWLTDLLAAILILLFVYTAINKLMDIENFRAVISKSPIIHRKANLISWFVPSAELIISLLLLIPVSKEFGFLFSSILMGIFTFYVAYMLLFVPNLPCSCGGVIQQMNWTQHLIFNIFFFLLSVFGWRIKRSMDKDFIAINRISRTPV